MSDKYHNEGIKSVDEKVFDVRAEYYWWIDNGCSHEVALNNAKSAERCALSIEKCKEIRNGRH